MMEIQEAIMARHAVRKYTDRRIEGGALIALREEAARCSAQGNLQIKLVTEEPGAFSGFVAHYGSFSGVCNYFVLIGKKSPDLQERIGYYGERVVLKAQQLGLNSCWVAATYNKNHCPEKPRKGESLVCVIPVGYGVTPGVPHKNRPMEKLCRADAPMPEWFRSGVQAAMLAPTAINQQQFLLTLSGDRVHAETTGGFYSRVDLGIVKYHFELGSGRGHEIWI
ncbi:MAG: nitroreductase family protein [Oscillospiraceae bacterium]|nr:nitroreductase family protein [Oscillospiraceae bacterium]